MRYDNQNRIVVAGLAGMLVLAALTPSVAAPVPTGGAAFKSAVASDVTDVRWRRGGWAAGGFVTGLGIGAIVGSRPYYPYYYDPYVYGPPPAVVYGPAPVYVEPPLGANGPLRQCWITTDQDRGFGYWRPC